MHTWGAYNTRLKVTLLPSKVYKNTRLFTISEVKSKTDVIIGLSQVTLPLVTTNKLSRPKDCYTHIIVL